MNPPHPPARFPRPRRALTVVEVLVALVVVSVGLLGMAGTSALSLRTATSAAVERRAVHRLTRRLAVLAAGGCTRAESGAQDDPGDGVRERWTVGVVTPDVAMVEATAQWLEGGRPRALALRSALLC